MHRVEDMMVMNRAERFTLITAIIGLLADVIVISVFTTSLLEACEQISIGSALFNITLFLLIYGWLVISWVIVRHYYLRWKAARQDSNEHYDDFMVLVFTATSAVGVLLLPVGLLWNFYWVGIGFMSWLGVSFVLAYFMPLVYTDMHNL